MTKRVSDIIIRLPNYKDGRTMSERDMQDAESGGGFGCWWMIVIGIIVVFAVLVGYLVLV